MRRYPLCAAVAATLALAACSSGTDSEPTTPPPTTSATSEASASSETPTAAPGQVSVSPGGVTTAVGAPAESTEEEYSQACIAARTWMTEQGGDPKSQIEPYLGMVQSTDSAGPGTYGTPWSQLSPGRQAAVIVAVQAAADALCG
ncbi:lipoprotein LpqV [Mycobacterium deserti]|uniref:Lipoprotein LpqV n=1 Tax=Mycobacterium deserti TaxID=2978347 RepID=A0ABT2M4V9_9MYCO|nr:lipoprotein LpqV [Mycobacterium deserti]MCT7657282.1 lipoprotein LpqV [Mycobacterium deserti]